MKEDITEGKRAIAFDLFCMGLKYPEIAERLTVSPRTVGRWALQYEWIRKRAERSNIDEQDDEEPEPIKPTKNKKKKIQPAQDIGNFDPDELERQILKVSGQFMASTERIVCAINKMMANVDIDGLVENGDLPVLNLMTNILKNAAQAYRLVVPDAPAHVRNKLIAELQKKEAM